MSIELHAIAGSPFSWRIHLAMLFKGIDFEFVTVQASAGGLRTPEFLAMNPRAKIPVLCDGDVVLYESKAILEYLEERFPDAPSLFPSELGARARARRLINEIDHYYFEGADVLSSNLYFKKPEDRDGAAIEKARAIVEKELAYFESQVQGEFLAGTLGAADFALYPWLAHLARYELRKPELGLTAKLGPKLSALMQNIEALPYYAETYPAHWKK